MVTAATYQPQFFLYSVIVGVILGIIYEFFLIMRIIFNKIPKMNFILDLFYIFICAIITYLFLLASNYGIIRIYIIVGELLGLYIYRNTVGVLTNKIVLFIAFNIFKLYKFIKIKLILPLNNKFKKILVVIWEKIVKNKTCYKKLKNTVKLKNLKKLKSK